MKLIVTVAYGSQNSANTITVTLTVSIVLKTNYSGKRFFFV